MSEAARLTGDAREALRAWGGASALRLVKARENVVFDATLSDGRRIALRLHRPGYQTKGAIAAELDWTTRLADAGLRVPMPVPAEGGAMTVQAGGRLVSAVAWLSGAPIGSAEAPLAGTPARQAETMRAVGALIGGLHEVTDGLRLPANFDRPRWDADGLLGEQPRWGRFWENPAFSEADRATLEKARIFARERLAEAGAGFGLIHADCLRENVLSDGGRLALIDFDDSGWGWRMYDLATAVYQSLEEPGLAVQAGALLKGYGERRPLPPDPERALTLFLMLRSFASAGWIVARAGAGDDQLSFRAARARRLAGLVLDRRVPWS